MEDGILQIRDQGYVMPLHFHSSLMANSYCFIHFTSRRVRDLPKKKEHEMTKNLVETTFHVNNAAYYSIYSGANCFLTGLCICWHLSSSTKFIFIISSFSSFMTNILWVNVLLFLSLDIEKRHLFSLFFLLMCLFLDFFLFHQNGLIPWYNLRQVLVDQMLFSHFVQHFLTYFYVE